MIADQVKLGSEQMRSPQEIGRLKNELGTALEDVGDLAAALSAAKEAVASARAADSPLDLESRADLAEALNNLSNRHAALRQHQEAFEAASEAWTIFHDLQEKDMKTFAARWVMATNNLANRLAAIDEHEEALELAKMAAELGQALLSVDRKQFEPDLAMYKSNLANRYITINQHKLAIPVAREAVEILERLSIEDADAHATELARAYLTSAIGLFKDGKIPAAKKEAQKSISSYIALFSISPGGYAASTVKALITFTSICIHANDIEEAKRASARAQQIISDDRIDPALIADLVSPVKLQSVWLARGRRDA